MTAESAKDQVRNKTGRWKILEFEIVLKISNKKINYKTKK